jgi:hypothetical protein
MPVPTNVTTVVVTGVYKNIISGAGESGTVEFVPNLKSLNDTTDDVILTAPPFVVVLAQGTGAFSIQLPTTDNSVFYPQSFSYTIREKVTNMGNRTTQNVKLPASLGPTVSLSDLLAPYI